MMDRRGGLEHMSGAQTRIQPSTSEMCLASPDKSGRESCGRSGGEREE